MARTAYRYAQVLLILLAALAAFRAYYGPALSEDAYIMLRYADNLAHGRGLVWNPGGPPVEGATSFLFTALEAAAISAGVAPTTAAQGLGFLFVFAGAVVLWYTLTCLGARAMLSTALALSYVAGPAMSLAVGGWDTPLFMLFTTSIVAVLLLYSKERLTDRGVARLVPVLCLAATLSRPEGLIWALLAFVWLCSRKRAMIGLAARTFAVSFVLPMLIFALWRHHFFGDWLPTPFYVKHDSPYHPDAVALALDLLFHQWLVVTLFLIVAISRFSFAQTSLLIFPIAHLAAFVLINNEQNIVSRFQFPAWPALALLAIYGIFQLTGSASGMRRLAANLLVGIALVVSVVSPTLRQPSAALPDTIVLGQALRPMADRGLWLCASEAGALPFHSGWLTIDPHGLNDPFIAHHGLDFAYLDRFEPAILQFHTTRSGDKLALGADPWSAMIRKLLQYCAWRGYVLTAVCVRAGVADDLDFYFVLGNRPYTAEVSRVLTSAKLDYLPPGRWPAYPGPHYVTP